MSFQDKMEMFLGQVPGFYVAHSNSKLILASLRAKLKNFTQFEMFFSNDIYEYVNM